MDIQPLLDEAISLLTAHPRDDFHDAAHHQRVWHNVERIAKTLTGDIHWDALQVATFWHDVMMSAESISLGDDKITAETLVHLKQSMAKRGYPSDFAQEVAEIMKPHGFLSFFQKTIESKLLFDADKLDALNPLRYRRIIAGIKNKKMSRVQIMLLANAARLWLKSMRNRYHFTKSRELHDQLIKALLQDKEANQIAAKWGVDIAVLVR